MKPSPSARAERNRSADPDETQRYASPPDYAGPPEVPAGMEEVAAWDEPRSAMGTRVQSIKPDDDAQTESLVSEGIEEADRELRLVANTESEDEPADTEADYPREGILS